MTIRTADLWCRKRPLYQLSHNHCPDRITLINGPSPVSFLFIFSLFTQTIQFSQQINMKKVISVQYKVLGFEHRASHS